MLAEATRRLAERSAATVLVARHASRFSNEAARYTLVDADWSTPSFVEVVTHAVKGTPIKRALLRRHHPDQVLPRLLPLLAQAHVVVVLGSMDGRPKVPDVAARVVTVRLGSKRASSGSRRWLTDHEISAGAIAAFTSRESQTVDDMEAV
jgi:hypothetical protein